MAKKIFTDESLATLVDEIKAYTDSAVSTKANKTHSHAISDVTNLQSALDGKADASHGTHVTFDSTNKPKMDGTSAFGTSTKVARADHVHPIDTSRASQIDLDALETVVAGKAPASHTHAISDVTNLQTKLDSKAESDHTHNYAGSSSAGGAATSANKVNSSLTVQLNGGTTEGTNKFTFNGSAVKSVNVTASSIGAAASSHTHDDRYYTETEMDAKLSGKADTNDLTSHITDNENPHGVTLAQLGVLADASELNYMEGVTSNVQTQLDGKAANSHGNHVPTTQTADNSTFLRNDNTWAVVTPANIGAATSGHGHALTDSTITGVLPIAKGGTGATSASGAITNLGAMDLASAQTASGVKTFTNGINIGNAKITYNSSTNILTFGL